MGKRAQCQVVVANTLQTLLASEGRSCSCQLLAARRLHMAAAIIVVVVVVLVAVVIILIIPSSTSP